MRVCYNQTLLRLTENFIKAYNRKHSAINQVAQNISRAYGRKLVGVTYQNQPAAHRQSAKYALKDIYVDHRHLVDNQRLAFEEVFLVFAENRLVLSVPRDLKEAVQSLCLVSRKLGHALRRSARWSREKYALTISLQYLDNGVQGSRLACARAARQHEKALGKRHFDRALLQIIVNDAVSFLA